MVFGLFSILGFVAIAHRSCVCCCCKALLLQICFEVYWVLSKTTSISISSVARTQILSLLNFESCVTWKLPSVLPRNFKLYFFFYISIYFFLFFLFSTVLEFLNA